MNKLKLSIIMPCLNAIDFIDESINSCLKQKELHELIIADGGSQKLTIEKLKNWENKDKRVKFYSRKNKNISQALNFALSKTNGNVIGWLNTDDIFTDGSFKRALNYFKFHKDKILVYGNGMNINDKGEFLEKYPSRFNNVSFSSFQDGCFICQPTTFVRKKALEEVRGLNIKINYAFDFDLWIRIFIKFGLEKIGFICNLQAYSRLHKSSITSNNQYLINIECASIIEEFIGKPYDNWLRTAAIYYFQEFGNKGIFNISNIKKKIEISSSIEKEFITHLKIIKNEFSIQKVYKKIEKKIPKEILLILFSRVDLINNFIEEGLDQKGFATWIINYGIYEYDHLFNSNITSRKELNDWIKTNYFVNKNFSYKAHFLKFINRFFKKKIGINSSNSRSTIYNYLNYKTGIFNYLINQFNKAKSFLRKKILKIKKVNIVLGQNHLDINPSEISSLIKSINSNIDIIISRNGYFHENEFCENKNLRDLNYDMTIYLMDLDELVDYLFKKNISHYITGFKIAYIDWDLEYVPNYYSSFVDFFDEIWTTNKMTYQAITKISKRIKLFNFPPFFDRNEFKNKKINTYGIKTHPNNVDFEKRNNYCFYTEVNFRDSLDKSNLSGSLNAFFKAFPQNSDCDDNNRVSFIIFIKNRHLNPLKFDYLKDSYEKDKRIKIIESNSNSFKEYEKLNCYVSLHRSCGYNSSIKKAYESNKSIIHTGFGGHLDYCIGRDIYPIKFDYYQINPKSYKYWTDQRWAEPKIQDASIKMRNVFLNSQKYYDKKNISQNIIELNNKISHKLLKLLKYL